MLLFKSGHVPVATHPSLAKASHMGRPGPWRRGTRNIPCRNGQVEKDLAREG